MKLKITIAGLALSLCAWPCRAGTGGAEAAGPALSEHGEQQYLPLPEFSPPKNPAGSKMRNVGPPLPPPPANSPPAADENGHPAGDIGPYRANESSPANDEDRPAIARSYILASLACPLVKESGIPGKAITSVSYSRGGSLLIAASADHTLSLFNVEACEFLRSFAGHRGAARAAVFSYDGAYILSGGDDSAVKLWDPATGECLRTFRGHRGPVTGVAFSPDGKYALSGSWDGTLKLWNAGTGRCLRTFSGHTGRVQGVAFSPDGKRALSGGWDGTLRLWEVRTGKCLRIFRGHIGYVRSVAFSPDGKYIVSGSGDNSLRLWDAGTGENLRKVWRGRMPDNPGDPRAAPDPAGKSVETGEYGVNSAVFSPDGEHIIGGGAGRPSVFLLDTEKLQATVAPFLDLPHTINVFGVAYSPDGTQAVSGHSNGELRVWDIKEILDSTGEEAPGDF